MTGKADVSGRMPRPATILGILDEEARDSVQRAGDILLEHVHTEAPGRGHLADAFKRRAGKTGTGQQVVVQPGRSTVLGQRGQTGAQVLRWVTRGTGVYRTSPGGRKTRIRGKRGAMVLPGGKRRYTVAGQRPNPFFQRARERAEADVQRELHEGRDRAARRLQELI